MTQTAATYAGSACKVRTDRFVAAACRASYYDFFLEFWPLVSGQKFIPSWHVEKLCAALQASLERVFAGLDKVEDVVWNQPPGTTKSKTLSVLLQPWAWTRMPACNFITGSYSERLALDFARQSRDVVTSDRYRQLFPDLKLREDQNTKGFFMNRQGGWRFSAGVGGTVQGMHAHFIGVDDPIDPLGALSTLVQDEANYWISETLSDRKVDKRLTVMWLIMQRLHQNDPAGHWLERAGGGQVRHVCVPCDDSWDVLPAEWRSYYAANGGLLDAVRLPRSVLQEAEAQGAEYYAGQYGQNPVPRGGAKFKVDRLQVRDDVPAVWAKGPLRYWDKAATKGGTGAYTAGVKGAVDGQGRVWVLDVVRGRWDSGERESLLLTTARRDGKGTRVGVEQEPAGSGKESAEATQKRLAAAGFSCYADRATGDKEVRADPFSVQVNLGNVVLARGPWNHAYAEEMRYFPRGRYADQVDASSGMYAGLAKPRLVVGTWRGRQPRP